MRLSAQTKTVFAKAWLADLELYIIREKIATFPKGEPVPDEWLEAQKTAEARAYRTQNAALEVYKELRGIKG